MKNLILILLCFFSNHFNSFAQTVEDITTGLSSPTFLLKEGNNLYCSQENGGKISKIDLSDTTYTVTDVVSVLQPLGLAIDNDYLYYSDAATLKIFRVNLTMATLTPELVYDSNNSFVMIDLKIDGTNLYFSMNAIDGSGIKGLFKMDLNDLTIPPVPILIDEYMYSLNIKNNYLYYSDYSTMIKRIDLSNNNYPIDTIVTGLDVGIGFYFVDSLMYIAESLGDKISIANINQSLPTTAIDFVTGLDYPHYLEFDGNNIFCSVTQEGGIVKINTIPVSTNTIKSKNNWTVFPNPTIEILNIEGFSISQSYLIIDALGRVVQQGTIEDDQTISVRSLKKGLYYLKLENQQVQQFSKN